MKKLSNESQQTYKKLQEEFGIDDEAGMLLLRKAMERHDTYLTCLEKIEKEGWTAPDRFGQVKAHALVSVMRDAYSQFLLSLKALNLDIEPLRDGPGRPPGT